tara:strand:- start:60 stop:248 length:189 start_codon:yes stop_codon:yes gene_type:complete
VKPIIKKRLLPLLDLFTTIRLKVKPPQARIRLSTRQGKYVVVLELNLTLANEARAKLEKKVK